MTSEQRRHTRGMCRGGQRGSAISRYNVYMYSASYPSDTRIHNGHIRPKRQPSHCFPASRHSLRQRNETGDGGVPSFANPAYARCNIAIFILCHSPPIALGLHPDRPNYFVRELRLRPRATQLPREVQRSGVVIQGVKDGRDHRHNPTMGLSQRYPQARLNSSS